MCLAEGPKTVCNFIHPPAEKSGTPLRLLSMEEDEDEDAASAVDEKRRSIRSTREKSRGTRRRCDLILIRNEMSNIFSRFLCLYVVLSAAAFSGAEDLDSALDRERETLPLAVVGLDGRGRLEAD